MKFEELTINEQLIDIFHLVMNSYGGTQHNKSEFTYMLRTVLFPEKKESPPPTVGQNHKCCVMNIRGPKYFTVVFGKQMGPSYKMESYHPNTTTNVTNASKFFVNSENIHLTFTFSTG